LAAVRLTLAGFRLTLAGFRLTPAAVPVRRTPDRAAGAASAPLRKTLDLMHTKYLKAYISYHGLQRRETFLFPDAALREALLNAVVHKDYSSGIPIQISVYDDRIVLWNSGDLPENWTLAKLLGKYPSCPFNPLIANAFFRAGYIESWGRGIQKIQRECREHGIEPPVYDFGMAGLLLTFRANPAHVLAALEQSQASATKEVTPQAAGEVTGKAPVKAQTPVETPDRIVELLRANPQMTLAEVAEVIGKSRRAVERATKKLVGDGRLRHVGQRKRGYGRSWNDPHRPIRALHAAKAELREPVHPVLEELQPLEGGQAEGPPDEGEIDSIRGLGRKILRRGRGEIRCRWERLSHGGTIAGRRPGAASRLCLRPWSPCRPSRPWNVAPQANARLAGAASARRLAGSRNASISRCSKCAVAGASASMPESSISAPTRRNLSIDSRDRPCPIR
jgi:Putative ATP-dependent DNA helicase recG C-terminal/Winged helix-turn-helix DNA-binding